MLAIITGLSLNCHFESLASVIPSEARNLLFVLASG